MTTKTTAKTAVQTVVTFESAIAETLREMSLSVIPYNPVGLGKYGDWSAEEKAQNETIVRPFRNAVAMKLHSIITTNPSEIAEAVKGLKVDGKTVKGTNFIGEYMDVVLTGTPRVWGKPKSSASLPASAPVQETFEQFRVKFPATMSDDKVSEYYIRYLQGK